MFSNVFNRVIGKIATLGGVVLLIFAFFAIPDEWDKHRNYVSARATVVSAATACRLDAKNTPWLYMPCDRAIEARKTNRDLANYTLTQFTKLSVQFVSPVDGKPHIAPLQLQTGESDWKTWRVGDVIDVIASKTQAEKVRDPVFGHIDVTDPRPFTALEARSGAGFMGDR
jgi:hypothetical protein